MPRHETTVGAPNLDGTDYARCEGCHQICEAGELDPDTGRCAECMPSRELSQAEELQP